MAQTLLSPIQARTADTDKTGFAHLSFSRSIDRSIPVVSKGQLLVPPDVHLVVAGDDAASPARAVDLDTPDAAVCRVPGAVADAQLGALLEHALHVLAGDGREHAKVDVFTLLILEKKHQFL